MLLFDSGKFPRAYALAQLALEELDKIRQIGVVEDKLKDGKIVDWKSFFDEFLSHKKKLKSGFLLTQFMIGRKTLKQEEIDELEGTVEKVNTLKNYSLYSTIRNSVFQKPSDIIGEGIAKSIMKVARIRFGFWEILVKSKPEEREERIKALCQQVRSWGSWDFLRAAFRRPVPGQ